MPKRNRHPNFSALTEPEVTWKFRAESEVGDKFGEKDDGGRCARRFSSNDSGSSTTEHDVTWHSRTKFAAEEQQKLDEKAVGNQAENEVESHVDEAKELQD